MLFGMLMLFVTGAASKQTSTADERQIRAQLSGQNVPEPIISPVVSSKSVSDDQLVSPCVSTANGRSPGRKRRDSDRRFDMERLSRFLVFSHYRVFRRRLTRLAPHHA